MENDQIALNNAVETIADTFLRLPGADFRWELAFPDLTDELFERLGAEPNTGWLFNTVRLDDKGFILTGSSNGFDENPYSTSMPGIFAVGDVRATSVKRVASAVGEGSVVVSYIHRYLADHARPALALAK
jgi:alkyl hydroperoxide reductase subunit AhpF